MSSKFTVFMSSILLAGTVNAASVGSTASTSTSTTKLTTSPVTFSFKNETAQNAKMLKDVGGASTDNQLKGIYNITPNLGVGVLVGGYYNIANSNQSQSNMNLVDMDLAVLATGKTDGILGSDLSLVEGRVYVPTSPTSKLNGQSSRLRMDITLPKNLGNGFSASLYFRPNYFTMKSSSTLSSYFESLTSIRGTYNFTKNSNVYASLDHWYDSVDNKMAARTAKEGLGPQIGAEYKFNSILKVSLDAEQTRNINAPAVYNLRKNYALLDPNDTTYRFIGVITY